MKTRTHRLTRQEAALEHLAAKIGAGNRDGAYLLKKLRGLESIAHHAAEDACNTPEGAALWEPRHKFITGRVKHAFGGVLPPGFFVNGDPRGYALKIDNENGKGKALIDETGLERDWGGYGILAPDAD